MSGKELIMAKTKDSIKRIGFAGIGRMGKPMSINVLKAGFPLTVYDKNKQALKEMEQLGASVAQNARQLGEHSDVLIIMLFNYEQIAEVVLAPQGALNGMKRDSTLIIMSSVDPQEVREIGSIAAKKGVAVLDAPVSGGIIKAEKGELSIMVGGNAESFNDNLTLFQVMGQNVKYVGKLGSGSALKLINQIMVEVNYVATVEAMAMAEALGLDLEQVFQMVTKSLRNSEVFQRSAPRIINRDFSPEGCVDIAVKDTKNILKTAMELGIPLPMCTAAHYVFSIAKSLGYGAQHHASLIKIYESFSQSERHLNHQN